jgi:hypothetical protein
MGTSVGACSHWKSEFQLPLSVTILLALASLTFDFDGLRWYAHLLTGCAGSAPIVVFQSCHSFRLRDHQVAVDDYCFTPLFKKQAILDQGRAMTAVLAQHHIFHCSRHSHEVVDRNYTQLQ